MRSTVFLLVLVFLCACSPDTGPSPATVGPEPGAAWAAPEAVERRVEEARERLGETEAGTVVWDAIEAHGGLKPWFSNGPLAFRFNYQRANGTSIDTYQQIDVWSSRAVHQLAAETTVQFGWTGEDAWIIPADAEIGTNARFWALTPYYFVGVPFVFADPGVRHELVDSLTVDGTTYPQVFVTFGDDVGDAPDDYYYMLLDPETSQVAGVRYIVTYPGFYDPGTQSPERLMLYEGQQTTSGLTFPTAYRTFAMTDNGPGEQTTTVALTDLAFRPDLPLNHFDLPTDASIQEEL